MTKKRWDDIFDAIKATLVLAVFAGFVISFVNQHVVSPMMKNYKECGTVFLCRPTPDRSESYGPSPFAAALGETANRPPRVSA